MNEYQQKAEAYVRQRLPELMELSFGCQLVRKSNDCPEYIIAEKPSEDTVELRCWDGWQTKQWVRENFKIIGHPIQLSDWLRVLENSNHAEFALNASGQLLNYAGEYRDGLAGFRMVHANPKLHFNLTTGQPASEGDYKAFCEIVGV